MTKQTTHSNGEDSFGRTHGAAAKDAVVQLGGDPDTLVRGHRSLPPNGTPGKVKQPSDLPGPKLPDPPIPTSSPLDAMDGEGERPNWLDPFLNGDLDIEDVADRLADEIQRDPRLMRTAWWQQFLNRLVAVLPDRLIDMAEHLSGVRHLLIKESAKR